MSSGLCTFLFVFLFFDENHYVELNVPSPIKRTCRNTKTQNPAKNPTRDPTRDPTRNPTRDPTRNPTRDPNSAFRFIVSIGLMGLTRKLVMQIIPVGNGQ
ncbi:hypothetical protein AC249_AIPGENE3658 [Exaiptasia diaphana]|nr:hypothetical protein AC249_AIPGENE3658 [Exaiptasia diaphana]